MRAMIMSAQYMTHPPEFRTKLDDNLRSHSCGRICLHKYLGKAGGGILGVT